MSSKKTIGVQVTKAEYDHIESLASAETRTISGFLRHVLYSQKILPGCSDTGRASRVAKRRKLALS